MKKNVAILTLACIFLAFGLVSCGEKKEVLVENNKEKFFLPTKDIAVVSENPKIELANLYIVNEPDFYESEPFANKQELVELKKLEYKSNIASPVSTYFGWDVFNGKNSSEGREFDSIVVDSSKYLKYLGYVTVFDKANNLGYVCSQEQVYCMKLSPEDGMLSWTLPFKDGQLCDRTLENKLIVYNSAEILLIDTKTASISYHYRFVSQQLIQLVLPCNGKLLICCKDYAMKGKEKKLTDNGYGIYIVDPEVKDNFALKFSKNIRLLKSHLNSVAFYDREDFFVIDNAFNTTSFKLADFHPGAAISEASYAYKGIEVDSFGFSLDGKSFYLNLDNPKILTELPGFIEPLNCTKRGHGWDYCFQKDGNLYGYDILTGETTWSITIDDDKSMLPYLSTENGVLLYGYGPNSDTYVVKAYTPKK